MKQKSTNYSEKILSEATNYMKTLESSLHKKSKFSNELLYQMAAMCTEKFFVSILALTGINASHHTPLALVKELETVMEVPEKIKKSAKMVGEFESICSISGFGYKMPNDEELKQIITGLIEIKEFAYSIFNKQVVSN